jgi:hypothetical protein
MSTATSYNNLALLYYGKGDFEMSYAYMEKAILASEKVLPSGHPHLVSSKEGLLMIKKELDENN